MISETFDADSLIQSMINRGWRWTETDVLVHPDDHELAIRYSDTTHQLTLSPKLEAHLSLIIPTPASKGRFRH
jgi:hypothetical protein